MNKIQEPRDRSRTRVAPRRKRAVASTRKRSVSLSLSVAYLGFRCGVFRRLFLLARCCDGQPLLYGASRGEEGLQVATLLSLVCKPILDENVHKAKGGEERKGEEEEEMALSLASMMLLR